MNTNYLQVKLDHEGDHLVDLTVGLIDRLRDDVLVLEVLDNVIHDQDRLLEVLLVEGGMRLFTLLDLKDEQNHEVEEFMLPELDQDVVDRVTIQVEDCLRIDD